MHIDKKNFLCLIPLLFIIYGNTLFADNTRTITINNQCDYDVLIGNIGVPINSNDKIVTCNKPYDYCFNGNGVCGEDNICYFKSLALKLGNDEYPEYYLRKQSTKIYDVDLIDINSNQQFILNIAPQYQCDISESDVIELNPEDFSTQDNEIEQDSNTQNNESINQTSDTKQASLKNENESNFIELVNEKSNSTTVSITFQNLDINLNNNSEDNSESPTEKIGDKKSTVISDVNLIDNIQQQIKKTVPNRLYQCLSADCNRSTVGSVSGKCIPTSKFYGPYTTAFIELNNKANDKYYISIENGINVPISITPVGDFGGQNIQSNFFCKTTGGNVSNDNTKLLGCSWDFEPPNEETFKRHLFTQIDRNLDADLVALCQEDSECNHGELCGLKYPEDIINYSDSGYCGKPIALHSITSLCNTSNISSNITSILKCENLTSNSNFIMDAQDIGTLQQNSVENRCPNSYVELTLNNNDKTKVKYCIHDIYNCKDRKLSVSGKYYKYLDSCYNYNYDSEQTGICCGCIDWPGIPTDNNFLCMPYSKEISPDTCDVDFSLSPPDCKSNYNTKTSKANESWVQLVKPHLEWLIKGCPDAKEYKFGDKHSVIQCSSEDIASNPGNNMNYLITFCPSNKMLFAADGANNKQEQFLKDFVVTNKISGAEQSQSQLFSDYKITINLSNAIIFLIFCITTVLLIAYFAFKRDV